MQLDNFYTYVYSFVGFPGGSDSKKSACNAGEPGQKDPPEEGMAIHSSIVAWTIS